MLELKQYSPAELAEVIQTSPERQQITRKLNRYNICFTCAGRGHNLIYTIEAIPHPFKVYCVFDLGIDPRADFRKLRNLFYYLFCVDGFAELPILEMAERLSETNAPVSRETIGKWLTYLAHINFVMFDTSDCVYYRINKVGGKMIHTEIDRETYNAGWRLYFERKEASGSSVAYEAMTKYVGGHPYKKAKMVENAFYQEEIHRLIDYINETFLE